MRSRGSWAQLAARAACLWAAVIVVTHAQSAPVRDNVGAPIGTATLSGIVTTDEANSQPLRRAKVIVSAGALGAPHATVTDDAGRFAVAGLVGGNYTLQATKAGFVTTYFGSRRPGRGPGVPVALIDGQRVDSLVIKVQRGAVITGTIRYQSGRPASGIAVLVGQIDVVNGQRRAAVTTSILGTTTSDDRGVYRVFGLVPGDYVVGIQPQPPTPVASLARPVTPSEVRWAEQVMANKGSGIGTTAAPPPPPEPGQTVSYAPVYFPGTTVATEATVITVAAGEERSSVDLSTTLVPTAKISGVIVDPSGQSPQSVRLSLVPVQSEGTAGIQADIVAALIGQGVVQTTPDGRFTIAGVAPGRYTLSGRGAPHSDATPARGTAPNPNNGAAMLSALFGGGNSSATLWANDELVVNGRDLSDVTLRLRPGLTVSGRVVYEGTTLQPPADPTRTTVVLNTRPTGSSPIALVTSMLTGLLASPVSADGTFAIKGVVPNTYNLSVGGAGMTQALAQTSGAGWVVKSAVLGGRDLADLPLEIKPEGDVTGLVITMTDRLTELSGGVSDQAGRPSSAFPIIVFSTNRAYWSLGSRRIQQVRPSTNGRFKTTGLPAGDYFVAAVTDLDPNDLYDPQFLDALSAGAIKITLAEGEKKTQDLKLGG